MKSQRSTRQRKIVLDTVKARRDHPSADQVYLYARGEDPRISRGTVYRNLNLLAEKSEIRHVKIPGVDRFDWRTEPHYHLLCTQCGKVTDISVPYRAELDRLLAEETGYEINHHNMVFEGICPDCAGKKKDNVQE